MPVPPSGRVSGSTVGSRKLGLRGFGPGEGVETEQEDKVSKINIVAEESVRMRYMLLGVLTGNTTAWHGAVHLLKSRRFSHKIAERKDGEGKSIKQRTCEAWRRVQSGLGKRRAPGTAYQDYQALASEDKLPQPWNLGATSNCRASRLDSHSQPDRPTHHQFSSSLLDAIHGRRVDPTQTTIFMLRMFATLLLFPPYLFVPFRFVQVLQS